MTAYTKPLPTRTALNAPFFEGLVAGRLMLQRCAGTGRFWFPPSSYSPYTLKPDWTWEAVSGRGKIWSGIIMHQQYFASFKDDLPYNVIMVELEEGPVLTSTLIDGNDRIACDAPVEVVFDRVHPDVVLPKFRLRSA